MQLSQAFAALFALSGAFVLSLGMALQKRNNAWIGSGRPWKPAVYRSFALWFLGFNLMNIVPAFSYFALMGLSPNIVGTGAGMSLVFTAFLAKFMLKERFGRRRLAWTAVLCVSIVAAALLGDSGSTGGSGLSKAAFLLFFALPLIVGLVGLALRPRLRGQRLASLLAAASGCLGGFTVFPLRALQLEAGSSLLGWLDSPYLYSFLAAGLAGFVFIQFAYKDGEMASVAPALYGMQVLWPAIGTIFIFSLRFAPAQAAAFAIVALSVAVIAGAAPVEGTGPRRP